MKITNLEVLNAQTKLLELGAREDIPIRASLDIALISNMVDVQVKAYGVVLQNLKKKYSIDAKQLETGGVQFSCIAKGETEEATLKLKEENIQAFMEGLEDLLEAKTEDLKFNKIKLPSDIKIKPEILKALIEFIEVV